MLPIAAAGFHVVAPDQRGYGQTTGWDGDYDGDVDSFRLLNLVRDALWLVSRSVTDRWRPSSGTTSAPLSRLAALSSGRTCFAPWC